MEKKSSDRVALYQHEEKLCVEISDLEFELRHTQSGTHNLRRAEIFRWKALHPLLEASIHIVSSFRSQYSYEEDEVEFVILKHGWRWKLVEERDAKLAEETSKANGEIHKEAEQQGLDPALITSFLGLWRYRAFVYQKFMIDLECDHLIC
jgi:hypothetical protein